MTRPLAPFLAVALVLALILGVPGDATTQATFPPGGPGPSATNVILTLGQLVQGLPGAELVMPLTRNLLSDSRFVQAVLQELDLNGDGVLTFQEVLSANALDVALRVERRLFNGNMDQALTAVGGDDSTLAAITGAYQTGLAADLALGAGGEGTPPGLSLRALKGDASGLIAALPRASLTAVSDRVADLDVRPYPAGDMVSPDMGVNARRKALLMDEVLRLFPLLEADRWGALRDGLRRLRMRADTSRPQVDWITGPKATGLVGKIDELLNLVPGR